MNNLLLYIETPSHHVHFVSDDDPWENPDPDGDILDSPDLESLEELIDKETADDFDYDIDGWFND
jgi:hypothetical protein